MVCDLPSSRADVHIYFKTEKISLNIIQYHRMITYFFKLINEVGKNKWACLSTFHLIYFYVKFMFQKQFIFLSKEKYKQLHKMTIL